MSVSDPSHLEAQLASQIVTLWRSQTAPFQAIVDDYAAVLQRAQESHVRAAQLDREANEARAENDTLLRALEAAKRGAVTQEEFAALQAVLTRTETDLTAAYKDKAMLAESSLQVTQQLSVVRDINEQQTREIKEAEAAIRTLRDQVRALRGEVERLEESVAMAGKEAEAQRNDATVSAARAAALEADNAALARRLVELKEAEIERMNDINRQGEEMLTSAKRQAAELLASASAQARAAGPGAAVASLERAARGLSLGEAAADALPAMLARSVPEAHGAGCFGLAFNRAGTALASCGADKTVKLWDAIAEGSAPMATLHGAFEGLNSVAWTQDGRSVVGAESRSALRVWAADTGRLAASLTGHAGRVTGVAASPADAALVASCAADRTIKLWGLDRGFCTRTLMCHSTCNAVAWASGAAGLASAHFDGALRLWDAASGRQVSEVAGLHGGQVCALDVGPSGVMALTAGKDNVVRVVDLRALRVQCTLTSRHFNVGGAWSVVALSADEHHAAAGSADGSVLIWDLTKPGTAPSRLSARQAASPVTALAWSPIGAPIVTGSKAGGVAFWDRAEDD
ncbi:hypothetical protein APUTEX25_002349 [Auxenochlorella protothecoides]|nr:hypothetical protein APUTEX25_002349 [Auxenochlorella protothecoides]|eukprot:RMZ57117.1 hypothetical protein APUTEX25_002349 [Auxenochlorella protothecoides]